MFSSERSHTCGQGQRRQCLALDTQLHLREPGGVLGQQGVKPLVGYVTRQAVIDLAKDLGFSCRQSITTLYDVYNADEAFLTGTAAEVIPMITCDGRNIGDGKPGEITQRIISAFRELVLTDGVRV